MFILQLTTTPPTDPTQKMVMRWMPVIFLPLQPDRLRASPSTGRLVEPDHDRIQYFIMRTHGVDTEIDMFFRNIARSG